VNGAGGGMPANVAEVLQGLHQSVDCRLG
jgi:hypothetical protein